jgi:uncharacterized protein
MYLIDTNIFLEILLEQEKSGECEALLHKAMQNSGFYVTSFTMHSIEVIMLRNDKIIELTEFLTDMNQSKIIRIESHTQDELSALNPMASFKLDFDDALQFYFCEKLGLKIISFDGHFDKTSIKRLEPNGI